MPSVTLPVTTSAKRHQVFYHIVTEPAPGLRVMDLQAFDGTALLAPPTISLQDGLFRNKFEPELHLRPAVSSAFSTAGNWLL